MNIPHNTVIPETQTADEIQTTAVSTRTNGVTRPPSPNPTHVPRPANAFMLFRKATVAILREQTLRKHEASAAIEKVRFQRQADMSKFISQVWRSLSDEDKGIWEEKAEVVRKEHEVKYPNYRYQPNSGRWKRNREEFEEAREENVEIVPIKPKLVRRKSNKTTPARSLRKSHRALMPSPIPSTPVSPILKPESPPPLLVAYPYPYPYPTPLHPSHPLANQFGEYGSFGSGFIDSTSTSTHPGFSTFSSPSLDPGSPFIESVPEDSPMLLDTSSFEDHTDTNHPATFLLGGLRQHDLNERHPPPTIIDTNLNGDNDKNTNDSSEIKIPDSAFDVGSLPQCQWSSESMNAVGDWDLFPLFDIDGLSYEPEKFKEASSLPFTMFGCVPASELS